MTTTGDGLGLAEHALYFYHEKFAYGFVILYKPLMTKHFVSNPKINCAS